MRRTARWVAAFSLALSAAAPAAEPAARNPRIDAIVAAVSPQRIETRVRKLASFHTRHTLSRTDSTTRGIGAARRWIHAEFEQCARAAGGRMQVAFDPYIEPPGRRLPQAVEIVNVVATLPGAQPEARERIYVVSGHYDSRASDVMEREPGELSAAVVAGPRRGRALGAACRRELSARLHRS